MALEAPVVSNCHYVSRFLTKPWEFGDRRLQYFDFDSDAILTASSKVLFSENEAYSGAVESFLSKYIRGDAS